MPHRRYRSVVKHAGEAALDRLEQLLDQLRQVPGLVERKRGVFYKRSRAVLHFHEDPTGLYADVRIGSDFERLRVVSDRERRKLLERVRGVSE